MEEIKTVHYHTKDPIQNLKIKVTLTRVSAPRPQPAVQSQVSAWRREAA